MPRLADLEQCVGCTACASICTQHCIIIEYDEAGFAYPAIVDDKKCVGCKMCEKVCPIITFHDLSGQAVCAYAAYSKDELSRVSSSSGGLFSEFARVILEEKGIVYGAVYDDNWSVKHVAVSTMEELNRMKGAKYSESKLENIFLEVEKYLKEGKKILFSGTPCQVAGLKAFVKKDYNNLFCIDFVCHGIPSPMAWKAYVDYRTQKDANGKLPNMINLRSKSTGWSKYQYSTVFEYDNGVVKKNSNSQNLFMKLFLGDYISRISCENCKFKGYARVSDITLGDFWGIWDIDSEMDDNKGTSVVLVQSEKGQSFWNEIGDKIKFKEVDLELTSRQNPSLIVSSKANPKRNEVLGKIKNGQIAECDNLFVSGL